jgi:hypothetical protein
MTGQSTNPYAPPQTLPAAEEAVLAVDPTGGLRRRSVGLMLVLCIVTLGLYVNYWTHRHALAIQHNVPREKVWMPAVWLFWIISVSSLLWVLPDFYYDTPTTISVGQTLDRIDVIYTIVMAFAVRSGLNGWTGAERGGRGWFHGFWTFLFGILYLQWKVNRLLKTGEMPPKAAQPDSKDVQAAGNAEPGAADRHERQDA